MFTDLNTRPRPLPGQLPVHYSPECMHSQPRRPARSQLCKLLGVHYRQKAQNNQLVGVGYSPASADNALLTVYSAEDAAGCVQAVSVDCACIPGNNALVVGPGVGVVVY